MKRFLLVMTLLSATGFSFADTIEMDLINAQKEIISLQKELRNTEAKLVKTYALGEICYDKKSDCNNRADLMRKLANRSVSVDASCYRERNDDVNAVCYGTHWMLKTKVRLLK